MIKYLILLLWLCLVLTDASLFAAPDTREVLDIQSACARMDMWGFREAVCCYKYCVVGNCVESQGRPICSGSRCAPGAGVGIGCALSGMK